MAVLVEGAEIRPGFIQGYKINQQKGYRDNLDTVMSLCSKAAESMLKFGDFREHMTARNSCLSPLSFKSPPLLISNMPLKIDPCV